MKEVLFLLSLFCLFISATAAGVLLSIPVSELDEDSKILWGREGRAAFYGGLIMTIVFSVLYFVLSGV